MPSKNQVLHSIPIIQNLGDDEVAAAPETLEMQADEITPSPGRGLSEPAESEISELAAEVYREEGMPEGRALEHWMEARRRLLVQRADSEQIRLQLP